jgi:hypothetical protein
MLPRELPHITLPRALPHTAVQQRYCYLICNLVLYDRLHGSNGMGAITGGSGTS